MYTIVENLSTWKELKDFLNQFNSKWVFRGQQDYSWGLQTGIDRIALDGLGIEKHAKQFIERLMLDRLTRHIYNIPTSYSSMLSSTIQKIAFLQHFGAPTRLLDFTISPYVALFFAIENAKTDCAIYAVNYFELMTRNVISRGLKNIVFPQAGISDPTTFDKMIFLNQENQFVEFMHPYFMFDRLISQSGCFLCQSDVNASFEENLQQTMNINLQFGQPFYKIKISSSLRLEILNELKIKMNIDRSTLFPGIDGFVQSLSLNSTLNLFQSLDK